MVLPRMRVHRYRMSKRTSDVTATIIDLAAGQHGVVARYQLVAAGVPAYAIDNRVRNGRLESLHRGVYRVVGPVRAALEREMAAVLACGMGAHLSHVSAAAVMGFVPAPGTDAPTHVTTTSRRPERGPGIRVHRVARLGTDDVTVVNGIPTIAAARTIMDLASVLGPKGLEQAVARAERAGFATVADVAGLVERHPGRRGVRALRAVLGLDGGPALLRSGAEELLLDMIRSAGLPAPRANVRVAGFEVDFSWSAPPLVVEVDGYTYHSSPAMLTRDRRRDRAIRAAGYDLLRYTLADLTEGRDGVLREIAQALVRR
jgi:very-short-patch-repair endonuclease